jgi:hypothetical protein
MSALETLPGRTFTGPPIDDAELIAELPSELAGELGHVNGVVAFDGGLHVRGVCWAPAWHSLRRAWTGEGAFHHAYTSLTPEDVPFAEDCLGDQFVLRDGRVWRLLAETDELQPLDEDLGGFLAAVAAGPVELLGLQPLLQFHRRGGALAPGQLLQAYPPFATSEAADGVSLRAVAADEQHAFLAAFAKAVRDTDDGGQVNIQVVQ